MAVMFSRPCYRRGSRDQTPAAEQAGRRVSLETLSPASQQLLLHLLQLQEVLEQLILSPVGEKVGTNRTVGDPPRPASPKANVKQTVAHSAASNSPLLLVEPREVAEASAGRSTASDKDSEDRGQSGSLVSKENSLIPSRVPNSDYENCLVPVSSQDSWISRQSQAMNTSADEEGNLEVRSLREARAGSAETVFEDWMPASIPWDIAETANNVHEPPAPTQTIDEHVWPTTGTSRPPCNYHKYPTGEDGPTSVVNIKDDDEPLAKGSCMENAAPSEISSTCWLETGGPSDEGEDEATCSSNTCSITSYLPDLLCGVPELPDLLVGCSKRGKPAD
jgi:hypothetical protein